MPKRNETAAKARTSTSQRTQQSKYHAIVENERNEQRKHNLLEAQNRERSAAKEVLEAKAFSVGDRVTDGKFAGHIVDIKLDGLQVQVRLRSGKVRTFNPAYLEKV